MVGVATLAAQLYPAGQALCVTPPAKDVQK
jgi:hypothetical protein